MTELALILVSAILVNNFVLVQFLGLCPFMGVSRKIETAIGLSLATTFVLTLAAMCSHILQRYVLRPLDLEYLRTIGFILVIAVVVQFTEMLVKKTSPLLYRVLGIFLPLITTNCIVLGVALLNANKNPASSRPLPRASAPGWAFPWCWCCSPPCASASPSPTCRRRSAARPSA